MKGYSAMTSPIVPTSEEKRERRRIAWARRRAANLEATRLEDRLRMQKRRAQDPERLRAIQRKSHAKHIEKRRAASRAHYQAHKEERSRYNAAYRLAHKEERAVKDRAYRQRVGETRRKKIREYHAQHKEQIAARRRAYRLEHPEELRARHARWRKANPEACQAHGQRRRALVANAPRNDLTREQWEAIKKHYKYRCVYCGKKMQRLTMEHLTPFSKGGSNTLDNVVPACKSCNSKKRDRGPLVPVQPLLLVV
jgi:5-methylcytosine-specific restriction endonuclease McrA